jgi:DNA-binding NarL/FixJ family response regulator
MTTILAVDDDRAFRGVLKELLGQDPNFCVIGEADNGEQAVRSTRELHPDVVLMDITMPRINGLEAAKRIKSYRPATKVVMVTVHSDMTYQQSALKNGADAFIAKKRVAAELLPTIHHIVKAAARGAANQQEPVSVFIVGDNVVFLNFAANYLRAQTTIAVTGCAQGGKEALAKSYSPRPEVVLVDLEMPGLTGLEVIRTLRRDIPSLGIIALTSLDVMRYRKWALAAGANACVEKSGLMTDLVPTILALGGGRDTPRN